MGVIALQRIFRDGNRQLPVAEGFIRAVDRIDLRCGKNLGYPPDKMKKYLTAVIIAAACALALGPLCAGFLGPSWRARWLLAWAANEYQNGHLDEAEKSLRRAGELSSEIATDPEFWKLKFEIVFNKEKPSDEAVSGLFEESMSQISAAPKLQQANIATYVAELFRLSRENDLAVEILDRFYAPISEREASENNTIAYFRSLTRKGLETALMEIDAALVADKKSRAEFLDTKAWVLHGLNRDELALPFAEEAIKKLKSQEERFSNVRQADRIAFHNLLFSDVVASEEVAIVPNRLDELKKRFPYVNPMEIDGLARKIAALRFHRACILDELGRTEESDLDYAWLDSFGFTETDKLN